MLKLGCGWGLLLFCLFSPIIVMSQNASSTHFDSQSYSENSGVQSQSAQDVVKQLSLKGNEHILDIDSGDGKITAQIG